MKRKTAHPNEYVSFDTIAELFEQELEDARDEHSRLSDLLCKYIGDDDVYILEDYVDDLQEYIDDLENLTDTLDCLMETKSRLSDDWDELRAKFKELGLL